MNAKTEKTCLDTQCQEAWEEFPPEIIEYAAKFNYCPMCAEELHIQCSACKEQLANTEFKFCPWCGAEFES